MDRDFVISIIKFLNRIGAIVNIELERQYMNRQGNQVVCMKVEVKLKGKTNYLQYHCYTIKNGKITYDEGNEVVPIKNGILAYLGNEKDVDNYFDVLTRTEAKKYFN